MHVFSLHTDIPLHTGLNAMICTGYNSLSAPFFSHQNLDVTFLYISHAPPQSHREGGLDTGQVCQNHHTTIQTLHMYV